jgi:hypothetical protein
LPLGISATSNDANDDNENNDNNNEVALFSGVGYVLLARTMQQSGRIVGVSFV